MIIRNSKEEDNDSILEILSQHNFQTPTGNIISQATIEDCGKIVAYGAVHLIAEEVLVMDKNLSLKQKSEVLELLHKKAIIDSVGKGFKEIHAFVQDSHFLQVLKKHYGYKDCKGRAIVMVF